MYPETGGRSIAFTDLYGPKRSTVPNPAGVEFKGWEKLISASLRRRPEGLLHPALRPVGAVEGAVLDGFGYVFGFDLRGLFDVGDGAGYFQNAVVGAGA